jgi:hypothetical protein
MRAIISPYFEAQRPLQMLYKGHADRIVIFLD